jgi:hypothetical protein
MAANGNVQNQPTGIAYPPREPPQKETLKNQPVQMALVAGLAWWVMVSAVFAGLAIWGPRAQYWLGWCVAGMVLLRGISEIWQKSMDSVRLLGFGVVGLALCVIWFFRGAVWTDSWLIPRRSVLKLYVAINGLGVVLILLGLIVRAIVEMFDPSWPATRDSIAGEHPPLLPIVWLWGGLQSWFDWMPLPSGRYDDESPEEEEEPRVQRAPVMVAYTDLDPHLQRRGSHNISNGQGGHQRNILIDVAVEQWEQARRVVLRGDGSVREDELGGGRVFPTHDANGDMGYRTWRDKMVEAGLVARDNPNHPNSGFSLTSAGKRFFERRVWDDGSFGSSVRPFVRQGAPKRV